MKTVRRRRHEKKTDYKARLALIKSNMPRLVIRKTNRYLITQIVNTKIAQDSVITGTSSKYLLEKGWPENKTGSLKSCVAAYLTGFLIGKMAKEKNIVRAILDIGMYRNVAKSRIYALLKGALDAGMQIPHNPSVIPSDSELTKNENLKNLLKIKEKL